MSFYEAANHPLIYGLVGAGLLYVLVISAISVRKSWRRAKELGYKTEQLMKIARSSVTFTIVPSIAIIVGFFSLAAILGIPWPWWRLSVVGSVTYEIMASEMTLNSAGVQLATATGSDFIMVMFVMSIGIIGGLVLSPIMSERIHTGSIKRGDQDKKWGALGNSVFMMAIIIAFVVPMLFDGPVKLLTLGTSIAVAFTLKKIAVTYKIAWLGEFILVLTMLIGMMSSVLWTGLLG